MKRLRISRRATLKGVGATIALPWLDAMSGHSVRASSAQQPPIRMAFLYVPNGKWMPAWLPVATGADYELPATLQPLASLKSSFNILSGLAQHKADANGDGGGDHARALTTFLTGVQAKKTDGADLRAGISVDQLAARQLGKHTRLPSLEMGADGGAQSGNCDSGYSCAYSSNIAWMTETQPVVKETDPRLIFDRLFGSTRPGESPAERARRLRYDRSILDMVREDAQRLSRQVGASDQRKLDQYLTAIRELELRIDKFASVSEDAIPAGRPAGVPKSYQQHLRILADLIVLAFQTDATRVSTMVFSNEGSNRSYSFIGVPEGHHDLSHHANDTDKQAKIQKIDQFHTTQLAYLLERLKAVQEADGWLLDNCMILYGSGIADGNAHAHHNLPILLAGNAGGRIATGRHLAYPDGTPLNNLYLKMLELSGVQAEPFGDSTGVLEV